VSPSGGASAQTVTFETGSSTTFKIDNAQDFTGTVVGLATNGSLVTKIDLANMALAGATLTYTGNTSSGVLTVSNGTIVSTINLTGDYVQADFVLSTDGSSTPDTLVTYTGTGMAAIGPSTVNQMASAMAAMGGGSSASGLSAGAAANSSSVPLALPHAA
jgi:hypothetical protein